MDSYKTIISKTLTINSVSTVVNLSNATLTTSVDKQYATIGDVLTYTLLATNIGTVDIYNVMFKDIMPPSVIFKANSIVIDNIEKPDFDSNIGFTLDTLYPNTSRVITLKGTVISVPNPNLIINLAMLSYNYKINPFGAELIKNTTSDKVTTIINKASCENIIKVDKLYATGGDTLTYISTIKNTGNIDLTNIMIEDLIPSNTTFHAYSVKIDGQPKLNLNPNLGILLGIIIPFQSVIIEFKVTVSSLPTHGFITNISYKL